MPCEEDVATALAGWGLLPGSLNGKLAVWEADETANLAAWPSEFAEVAAEAACDPAGGAKVAAPLQQAAAAAANAAGLVPQVRTGCWQLVLVWDAGMEVSGLLYGACLAPSCGTATFLKRQLSVKRRVFAQQARILTRDCWQGTCAAAAAATRR